MKKITIICFVFLLGFTKYSCSQNNVSEMIFTNHLVNQSQLNFGGGDEFASFLRPMQTDSMNDKIKLLNLFMNQNEDNKGIENIIYKALAYSNLKWYDSALVYFNEALILQDKDPYIYYFRGDTYCHMHKFSNAIDDFSRAILLDQNFYMAFYFRGLCYYAIGDVNKAMIDLSKTYKLVKASVKSA